MIIAHNWNMSQDIRKIFALNIKTLREKKGLKKEELSLLLGLESFVTHAVAFVCGVIVGLALKKRPK